MSFRYLTVGHNNSPYITTYSKSGDTYTKLTNPSSLPTADVYSVDWNYNATSLAVAQFLTSPYVIVYNFSDGVYTKIAELSDVAGCLAVAWSPDGSKLAVGDTDSPYVRIYNRSGDTFTPISNPANLPAGSAQELAWSPDGAKLAVAHSTSPYITVYTVSGDTFTKVADPSILPYNSGLAVAWNPTSDVLAVGGEGSASITPGRIYNFASNTLSLASNIGSTGSGVLIARQTITWKPDGSQLAIRATVYDRSGNTYSSVGSNISVSGTIQSVRWDNTGNIIAIGHSVSPYVSIFNQVSSSGFVKVADPNTLPAGSGRSIDWAAVTGITGGATTTTVASITALAITLHPAIANLTAVSTLTAKVLGDILYVVDDYIDTGYFIQGSDFDYFEPDYIEDDYIAAPFRFGEATVNSNFSLTASLTRLQSGTVDLNSSSAVTTVGERTRAADSQLTTTITLSNQPEALKVASVNLTAFNTTLTVGVKLAKAALTVTAAVNLSATAEALKTVSTQINSTLALTNIAIVNRTAAISITAVSTVSAVANRIANGVWSNLDSAKPTGIKFNASYHPVLYPQQYPTGSASIFQGAAGPNNPAYYSPPGLSVDNVTQISFWAAVSEYGCLISSAGPEGGSFASSLSDFISFSIISNTVVLEAGKNLSNGAPWWIRRLTYYADNSQMSTWRHYAINLVTFEVWVNGSSLGLLTDVYTKEDLGAPSSTQWQYNIYQPINIGSKIKVSGQVSQGRTYTWTDQAVGAIAQLWLGKTDANNDMAISAIIPDGEYWPLTAEQTSWYSPRGFDGYNKTFDKVSFYDELDYPYEQFSPDGIQGIPASPDTSSRYLVVQGRVGTSYGYQTNEGWVPELAFNQIIPGYANVIFTLTSAGIKVRVIEAVAFTSTFTLTNLGGLYLAGVASLTAVATLTATASYLKPGTVSSTANTTLTALGGYVQPVIANLTATTTFSATAGEISSGVVLGPTTFTLTALLSELKNDATATLIVSASLTADSTTNSLGRVDMAVSTSCSANARVTYPIRPESMVMSAAFTQTSTGKRFRDSPVPLSTAFTFANGVTRALKSGVVAMAAFDTVLSAGKIVEFLAENTVVVNEEQRLLRVALESTVLLVQMANGVNTITAETTDIVVPQEQGRLLAQHNMPTN